MKGIVFTGVGDPIQVQDVSIEAPSESSILVELKAGALNHRDVFITQGLYPGIVEGTVLGSCGAGVYDGQPVIINPNVNWGPNPKYFGRNYSILGMPINGTFAEGIWTSKDRLADMPSHLSFEQAAALPLAGLTAYRALISKCQVTAQDQVLISGIGGGVALFAFQFALAVGAKVFVTSSSQAKIDRAIAMGAAGGARYTEPNWHKAFMKEVGGFDVIIDSAGGDGFGALTSLANPCGRIGIYGGTRGAINRLSPQKIFWKQLEIYGSTMGNDQEFQDMTAFVNQHKIVPIVDEVFSMEHGANAFKKMEEGKQFGKIVLKISD